MRPSLLALFLLLAVLTPCSLALSESEKFALDRFYANFANLRLITPPWSSDSSQACIPPGFYGVECDTARQHVIGLYAGLLFLDNNVGLLLHQIPGHLVPILLQSSLFLTELCFFYRTFRNTMLIGSLPPELNGLSYLESLYVTNSAPCALQYHANAPFSSASVE